MPGKHAPKSPVSFYLSLSRAAAGVVGALALVAILAVVAFGNRGAKKVDSGGVPAGTTPVPTVSAPPIDSSSPSPTSSGRAPSSVRVIILNGANRTGLAGKTRTKVAAAGYNVVEIGNSNVRPKSTIFYQPGFKDEALALQARFPGFTQVQPADHTTPAGADLTLILGTDYPST